MKSHTFIFTATEEILSSSPVDLVSASAAISTIALRCDAAVKAERPGANGFAVMTALTAH